MSFRAGGTRPSRVLWLAACLVFGVGCRLIAVRETAIANAGLATDQLTRKIEMNDAIIARADTLRQQEQLVRRDLLKLSTWQQPAISIAAFLRRLEYLGSQLGVAVVSVTPSSELRTTRSAASALAALPVTVLVRGDFPALVRFIQEVTRQRSLTGVESVQMAISSLAARRRRSLEATLHLTLYRVRPNLADAPTH